MASETYAQLTAKRQQINQTYKTNTAASTAKYQTAVATHTEELSEAFNTMNADMMAAFKEYETNNTSH